MHGEKWSNEKKSKVTRAYMVKCKKRLLIQAYKKLAKKKYYKLKKYFMNLSNSYSSHILHLY